MRPALILGALLTFPPPATASSVPIVSRLTESIVAVGIAHRVARLVIKPEGRFQVIDQSTGELTDLESGREYTLEAEGDRRLIFGPHLFFGPTRILPSAPEHFVWIGERKYRGNIIFRPHADDTLTAIDEIGIEEYLYGVLPREMSPEWPLEALKAQAVVARTFALNNLGKHADQGYDLTADARSQIYDGITVDSERIRKAVKETRGKVLFWKGKRLSVYFHSACGGHTTDPVSVWGNGPKAPRPLAGVRDRWCRLSPHQAWQAYFTREEVTKRLGPLLPRLIHLSAIRVGRRDAAGYARSIRVKSGSKWREFSAHQFRLAMGAMDLKSLRLTRIRSKKRGFLFEGEGYGHGVGLCQWGARSQAESGRNYREILAHYFPGAAIVRWEE